MDKCAKMVVLSLYFVAIYSAFCRGMVTIKYIPKQDAPTQWQQQEGKSRDGTAI
jgi:hypothetical protein